MTSFNQFAPTCAECGKVGRLVDGSGVYPHRPDLHSKAYYRCDCGAYVGCHPGTNRALGSPAGPNTRRARTAAHDAFDPLWKAGSMRRSEAYKALAAQLGISASECHISWFGSSGCAQVIDAAALIKAGRSAARPIDTDALADVCRLAERLDTPITINPQSGVSA